MCCHPDLNRYILDVLQTMKPLLEKVHVNCKWMLHVAGFDNFSNDSIHYHDVMPAMLVTRTGILTNESMSIKDLDQYSITAKVNIHQEQ